MRSIAQASNMQTQAVCVPGARYWLLSAPLASKFVRRPCRTPQVAVRGDHLRRRHVVHGYSVLPFYPPESRPLHSGCADHHVERDAVLIQKKSRTFLGLQTARTRMAGIRNSRLFILNICRPVSLFPRHRQASVKIQDDE